MPIDEKYKQPKYIVRLIQIASAEYNIQDKSTQHTYQNEQLSGIFWSYIFCK